MANASAMRAPILDDYTGPVLIDGIAAPQFFRQLLSRGITGQADPVGAPRRGGQGADDLESRVGKRILPPTFQIYDDPRNEKFQGNFLTGHYLVDDEGIPAQRVNIVVDGKVDSLVMSRTPTKQFAQSNGHGRRAGGETPRSTMGCLYIESTKGESPEDLKKELRDAADSEGLKFGLRVTSLQNRAGGGAGFGGRGGRGGGPAAARVIGDPISIYKVYVADGREEPVRGCEFSTVDLRSLRRIIAAGNVSAVHNSAGGAAPSSSVIAPAILFEELELSLIKRETDKKPIIEAPHARNVSAR
jgi:TldD protein